MEQSNQPATENSPNPRRAGGSERRRSSSNTGEGGYRSVARQAVSSEADVKADSGPAVSNTYVGETVNVENHYHF